MTPVDKAVLDSLSTGIQGELAAYVFYKKAMKIVRDLNLVSVLARLAIEEKSHYQILEGQYDSLVRSEMWNTLSDVLRREGLPDIEEKMETVHESFIDELTDGTPSLRVLEMALFLEERAFNLYTGFAQKTENTNGRRMYEQLARFESAHIIKVKNMMENLK